MNCCRTPMDAAKCQRLMRVQRDWMRPSLPTAIAASSCRAEESHRFSHLMISNLGIDFRRGDVSVT